MFDEEEIRKIFKVLGLKTKKERQAILSQGVSHKPKSKAKYQIALDNATAVNNEGGPQDSRLE